MENLDPVFTTPEEKDEEIFTPKKYKVRPGTIDWGKDYEIKATALLALKCCSEELQDFWLGANVHDCGALDDIILYKKSKENDQGITYCMQLKHQETSKNLVKDMFLSPNGDFSPKKYVLCYSKLQSKIEDKNKEADIIKHFRQVKKLVFIIFTNKGVNENCQFLHRVNEKHLNAIRMGGDAFMFDHNTFPEIRKDFLNDLYLFTSQPLCKNMDNEIIGEIKNLLHSLEIPEVRLRDIALKFVVFITEWSKGLLGGHYPITKMHILKKLTELLLLPYTFKLREPKYKKDDRNENKEENEETAKEDNIGDDEEENIWHELIRDKDVTVIDEVDDVVQQYVNDATYNIVSNTNMSDFKTPINKALLRVVSNLKNISESDKYEWLWKAREIPLLIQTCDLQGIKDIQNILKAFPEVYRTIILNKAEDEFGKVETLKPYNSYKTDLSEKHQEQILQRPIKLQGRELLIKELNIDKKQFFRSLKVKDIVHILGGQFNIGGDLEPLPDFFIEMSLTRTILDITVLEKVQNMFVVQCKSLSNLKSYLNHQLTLSENEIVEWEHLDKNNFVGRIIIFDLIENLYEIERYCLTLEKTVHLLVWHGSDNLEWVKSNNAIANLRRYIISSESTQIESVFAKDAIIHVCQNKKTLLVSANPGMGKSVLINYFARNVPINLWVLKVTLAKHKDHYKIWNTENCNSKEVKYKYFEEFLKEALKEQHTCNRNILDLNFKQYLNSKNVVLLLDGFDEVPLHCQNGAKKLLKFINESGYYTCVTTRPVLKRDLESVLNTFAVTLNRFTTAEQTYFLTNYFAHIVNITPSDKKVISFVTKLLEAAKENLNETDNKFTGIPLQTKLLAEVFKNDFKKYLDEEIFKNQYFDLIYLYEHFINEKIKIACSKVDQDMIYQYRKCRSIYALQHLFTYEDLQELQIVGKLKAVTEMIPDIAQGIQKDGIIVTDSELKVSFVHQTYAEFLVAEWLSDNINTSDRTIALKLIKKTFDPNFLMVRNMFDRLLAKNYSLHTAIINRQLSTVKEKIDSDENAFVTTDKGGRTIFHLIAAWGLHHPDQFTSITYDMVNSDFMLIILKLIPSNKLTNVEDLLNYTPLDYAVLNRSLSIADNICSKIKNPKSCVNITESEAGSMLNYVDKYYSVSLFAVILICHTRTGFQFNSTSDLQVAISKGNIENVRALVSHKNINAKDHNGCTPLHVAVKHGDTEITRYLLSRKVNVNKRDYNGRSALHWASYQRHLDIVSLLITEEVKVSTTDCCNRTALHYALLFPSTNQADIASILIKRHLRHFSKNNKMLNAVYKKAAKVVNKIINTADFINIKDNHNMNALHWATQIGQIDVVDLLLSTEADVNAKGRNNMTALHIAVANNHLDVINLLLTNDADIEAKSEKNQTPLHFAALYGQTDVVSVLLTKGAKIDAKDDNDETPLHLAVSRGHKDVVDLLLENDADIEAKDKNVKAPLHFAASRGHKDVVNLLLENGADIEAKDKCGETPLYMAVNTNHRDVVSLLLTKGADINAKNGNNETRLHLAAYNGNTDLVSYLLTNGADIEAKGKYDRTPLHVAVYFGKKDVVSYLVTNGADIEAKDKDNRTPLHFAARRGHKDVVSLLLSNDANIEVRDQDAQTPLHYAAVHGQKDVISYLLTEGADVEAKDKDDETPLHCAATRGHKDVVSLLLSSDATIEAKDKNGRTPLHLAADNNQKNVISYLLNKGANIEAKDKDDKTPLHFAAGRGHDEVARLLLTNGAYIDAKDKDNVTPFYVAAKRGHEKVIGLLKYKGAYIDSKDRASILTYIPNIPSSEINHKSYRTPLHVAAAYGQKDVVSYLLNIGADIEAKDKDDRTPLHIAAKKRQKHIISYLLSNGADIEAKDKDDKTPLHLAAHFVKKDVVSYLLSNGADIEAKDKYGITPLHFAAGMDHKDVIRLLLTNSADIEAKDKDDKTPLHVAAEMGHSNVIRLFLANGADIETKDKYEKTPLHYAAHCGRKNVVCLLLTNGAEIAVKDKDDRTPLHYAAVNCRKAVVSYLSSNGSEIEAKDKDDRTPLHYAAQFGKKDVVSYLLANGADIERKDKDDRTPLHFAAQFGKKGVVRHLLRKGADIDAKDKDDRTPFHGAAYFGKKYLVNYLLTNGASIEAKDKDDRTPLHFAAYFGKKDVVSYLLTNGASIEAKDKDDRTPLHFAAYFGKKDVVSYLLSNSADIEVKDQYGLTPLHFAAQKGHKGVIRLLLNNGADIEAKNKNDKTPLHLAMKCGQTKVVRLLSTNGAKPEAKNERSETSLHFAEHGDNKDVVSLLLPKGVDTDVKKSALFLATH